jgi:hypothetical protein
MSPKPAPLDTGDSAWIVVYEDGTDPDAVTDALAAEHGFVPRHVFRHALLGFAADLSADALAAIRRHPAVKYAEPDGEVSIN